MIKIIGLLLDFLFPERKSTHPFVVGDRVSFCEISEDLSKKEKDFLKELLRKFSDCELVVTKRLCWKGGLFCPPAWAVNIELNGKTILNSSGHPWPFNICWLEKCQ